MTFRFVLSDESMGHNHLEMLMGDMEFCFVLSGPPRAQLWHFDMLIGQKLWCTSTLHWKSYYEVSQM